MRLLASKTSIFPLLVLISHPSLTYDISKIFWKSGHPDFYRPTVQQQLEPFIRSDDMYQVSQYLLFSPLPSSSLLVLPLLSHSFKASCSNRIFVACKARPTCITDAYKQNRMASVDYSALEFIDICRETDISAVKEGLQRIRTAMPKEKK